MSAQDQKPKARSSKLEAVLAEAKQGRRERENTYREQALKLFPWVCAKCGREFDGQSLKQLTVHHKDHNHDNNPPDGSNWELLCVYCHEDEHARNQVSDSYSQARPSSKEPKAAAHTHQPFAGLEDLLKKGKG